MSVKVIHLNKLIKLLALADAPLTSALREDLRAERKKLDGMDAGGGDFHAPFWSDVKAHVIGALSLQSQTQIRIESHGGRKRLYPLLQTGFLKWFDALKRSTNEKVGWLPERIHNHYEVPELGVVVKVDNLLGLQIGSDKHKLVYPYFSEQPILSERWARVALWLMREALPDYSVTDMEMLDVLRGRSFSGASIFFKGDEEALFADRYKQILAKWMELRPEYGLP